MHDEYCTFLKMFHSELDERCAAAYSSGDQDRANHFAAMRSAVQKCAEVYEELLQQEAREKARQEMEKNKVGTMFQPTYKYES